MDQDSVVPGFTMDVAAGQDGKDIDYVDARGAWRGGNLLPMEQITPAVLDMMQALGGVLGDC